MVQNGLRVVSLLMDHKFELKLSKHNLILASVNPEDAGRYSISAKNAAGFSNTKFEIIVNQPPKFEIKPPITHSGTVELFILYSRITPPLLTQDQNELDI